MGINQAVQIIVNVGDKNDVIVSFNRNRQMSKWSEMDIVFLQYLVIYLEMDYTMINTFVALDIETTGLNPAEDKIIEIGMAKISDGEIVDSYSTLVNPGIKISERITMITGITDDMVEGKPAITEIISDIVDFTKDMPILGHNVIFDYSFIKKAAVNSGLDFKKSGIDTLKLSRRLLPEVPHKTLEYLCGYFGIDAGNSHRAMMMH